MILSVEIVEKKILQVVVNCHCLGLIATASS